MRIRVVFTGVVVGATALLLPRAAVSAQQNGTPVGRTARAYGAIDGSVRDTSGAWLSGVEVVAIDNSLIRTRSGAGGAFRIDSLPAGPHLIRFRRIGIMPTTVSVVVEPDATISVDAVVEPFPITLSRVIVQAVSGELVHLPPGVADRMRTGIGTYLTAAQIESFHSRTTADIFRHVAGVAVEYYGHTPVVRSERGVQTIHGNACTTGMAVVVDGAVMNTSLSAATRDSAPSNLAAAAGTLDAVSPRDIAAIEIYKDGAETPASLRDSECGVIYIWTR
ncbi:MAG TPA: carboxypeptidase regulatory-like domain-containing protein [Gemmatimonadaceae bacterium]|nr:carboxypeptidase regulatory-like domain-containing protein [Gemmatimonadaceae bacterium]